MINQRYTIAVNFSIHECTFVLSVLNVSNNAYHGNSFIILHNFLLMCIDFIFLISDMIDFSDSVFISVREFLHFLLHSSVVPLVKEI